MKFQGPYICRNAIMLAAVAFIFLVGKQKDLTAIFLAGAIVSAAICLYLRFRK